MDKQLKRDIINLMFNQYGLDTYQKDCIEKVIDGCVELASYTDPDIDEGDLDTIAGLVRSHILKILKILGIERDGKRRIETAES
mgnify:FL=1